MVLGVVTGCLTAEIHREANDNSPIECKIDSLTPMMVDKRASTNDWYKVYSGYGDGYCKKEFVALRNDD